MASPQTLVPEIRFRGFSDEWTKRKIEEFCDVVIGEFVIKTKQRDDALYPVYNGGKSNTGFYDEFNQEGKKVIISARGAAGYVNRCETRFWAGNSCYSLSILDNSDWNCLYHCLKKKQSDLIREQQSANIPSVSKQAVIETLISMPGPEEQRKIATLLDHIDSIIELNKKEYTQYKNVKKSMLEKMFPRDGNNVPEIRFAGFTNPWEQRKLGELAIFNPKAELPDVFEYVDLESVVGTEMLSHRTESKRTAPSRAQRLAQTGDLFYQTVRPYQKNNYLFEKPDKHYVFSTGYAQMRPVVDGRFLLCLVQSDGFVKVVLDNCTGTSYPAINSNDLAEIKVYSPGNPQEQKQIGDFFKGIDNLITLHQRKYEMLQKIKNSLLQKMLV